MKEAWSSERFRESNQPSVKLCRARWLTALLVACFSLPAAAQFVPPTAAMRIYLLGSKREMREEYKRSRRLHATERDFNAAQGRFQAALEMRGQQQSRAARLSASTWVNIGPGPTTNGQTPTSTPRFPSDVSGRVSAIAIDGSSGSVYVGGAQGGVWKSIDGGATWIPLSDNLMSTAVGSIALDPNNPGWIYLGTGEGNGTCDSYGGVGVYKSTDGGGTWAGPFGGTQFTNRGIPSMAVDRTNGNIVMAASASGIFGNGCVLGPTTPSRGIFRSTDAGLTWVEKTAGNNRASVVLQDPISANVWWGAMWYTGNGGGPDGGLLKSTDSGNTWTQLAGVGGLPAAGSSWSRAWVTATSDGSPMPQTVLYVGSGAGGGSVYKSMDTGATWTTLTAAAGYCNPQCFYDMPIYVEPGNPNVFYAGGAGTSSPGVTPSQFMRSDNGGTTFADKVRSADGTTAQHADVHAITSWPGVDNEIWVGNDGGIWKSTDRGDNWINVNNNLAITQFQGCDLGPASATQAYGGTQDNGTMGWTGQAAWPHLDFGDGGFALIDQGNPNNLVHTYWNATNQLIGVGYTTAGFATTMGFYAGSFASGNGIAISDRVLFYAPIHLDRGVTDTLYFGTHRLYRAPGFFGGGLFSVISPDLAPTSDGLGRAGALSAIETVANPVPGQNAQILFTGARGGDVFRSTDGGGSWGAVDGPTAIPAGPNLFVSDVLVDPANTNLVYQSRAGFSGAAGQNVRRSTDGGATWAASGTGIPDVPVNALAFDPVDNWIWAGTDVGAYVSTDGAVTWAPMSIGMATVAVFDMESNPVTKTLIACTHGRSVYMLSDRIFVDGFETSNTSAWSYTTSP